MEVMCVFLPLYGVVGWGRVWGKEGEGELVPCGRNGGRWSDGGRGEKAAHWAAGRVGRGSEGGREGVTGYGPHLQLAYCSTIGNNGCCCFGGCCCDCCCCCCCCLKCNASVAGRFGCIGGQSGGGVGEKERRKEEERRKHLQFVLPPPLPSPPPFPPLNASCVKGITYVREE